MATSQEHKTFIKDVRRRLLQNTRKQLDKEMDEPDGPKLYVGAHKDQVQLVVRMSAEGEGALTPIRSRLNSVQSAASALSVHSASARSGSAEGSGPAAPLNKHLMELMREAVLRVTKAFYWELVDEGCLPKCSLVTRYLIDSTDIAMMDVRTHLSDWKMLTEKLELGRYKTKTEFDTRTVWAKLFIDPGSWERYQQRGIITCLGYIHAHWFALEELEHFRLTHGNTPEEKAFVQEVLECIQEAENLLAVFDKDVITLLKTKMLGARINKSEQHECHHLAEKGFISDAAAHTLEHELIVSAGPLERKAAAQFDLPNIDLDEVHDPVSFFSSPITSTFRAILWIVDGVTWPARRKARNVARRWAP